MPLITVPEDVVAQIDAAAKLETNINITNDQEQAHVATTLAEIKSNAKELDRKKSAILKPLNAAVKEIRAQFKPAETRLADAEAACKGALLAYHNQREAEANKQLAAIEKKVESGRMKPETAMQRIVDVEVPRTDLRGMQVRWTPYKVKVVDPLLVPTVYLYSPAVVDAIRKEIQKDVDAGMDCPAGAKLERKRTIAGVA